MVSRRPLRGSWKMRAIRAITESWEMENRWGGRDFYARGSLECGHTFSIMSIVRVGDRLRCYDCGWDKQIVGKQCPECGSTALKIVGTALKYAEVYCANCKDYVDIKLEKVL